MKPARLLPLLVLAAGCRNPAPGYVPVTPEEVPKVTLESVKEAKDLTPLTVGEHWTYAVRDQAFGKDDQPLKDQRLNADVDIAARWPDGTVVLEFRVRGELVDRQAWHGDATGLYEVEGGVRGVPFRPTLPLAPLPLKAGKRFDWQGRGPSLAGAVSRVEMTGEILAPQNVDLTQGTVSAIPVVTHTHYVDGDIDSTSWFRPGTGLVRLYQETKTKGQRQVQTLTLTTHTTKTR